MRSALLTGILLTAAISAVIAESPEYRPDELVIDTRFSSLDILPFPDNWPIAAASLSETPALAGARRSDRARRLESSGARPFDSFEGNRSVSETLIAGGLIAETAFGGLRCSIGGEFGGGDILAFSRLDLSAEYDYLLEPSEGDRSLGFGLAGGFAGNEPFPWVVAGRAVLKGTEGEKYATLVAEAGDSIVDIEGLGIISAAGALGLDLGNAGTALAGIEPFFRARAELEGRNWRGALARGLAAWTVGEARLNSSSKGIDAELSAGMEGSARFGAFGSLSGRLLFLASTEGRDDWAELIRGLTPERADIEGALGAVVSLEARALFARGTLFTKQDLGVEFFAKPYLDIAVVRPSGGALFSADALYAACGCELAMTIDRDRRQCLRLGAGLDLTGAARGEGMPSSGDVSATALFAFAF